MKKILLVLSISTSIAFATLSLHADYLRPYSVDQDKPSVDRIYVAGNISYAFSNSLKNAILSDEVYPNTPHDIPSTTATSIDKFIGSSFEIGYTLTPIYRVGAEYNYGKTKNTIQGKTWSGTQNDTQKSNITMNTFTVNGYINLNGVAGLNFGKFNPYIGAGLGVAVNKQGVITETATGNTSPGASEINGKTKTAFAWQIMLGTQYSLTKNLSLNVGYKYTSAGKTESGTIENDPSSSVPLSVSPQKSDLHSNEIYAGLLYQF